MATTVLINSLVLVIVLSVTCISNCENEVKPTFAMEDIENAEHLLRGSNEKPLEEVNSKPDKEEDSKTESSKIESKELEEQEKEDKKEDKENSTSTDAPNESIERTTEAVTTTTVSDVTVTPSAKAEEVKVKEDKEKEEEEKLDTEEVQTTPVDMTETVNDYEATTMSTLDNVYKSKESMEDIYNASDRSNVKFTTTSTIGTTRAPTTSSTAAMDDLEPLVLKVPDADESDSPGVRNPKTDDTERIPTIDKRNFAPHPHFPATDSKSSTLKNWLEDSWLRPPAGVLVPLRPMALTRALAIWNDLTSEGLNVTDIVIVGYDSNGVNWRSRHNLQHRGSVGGKRAVSEALSKLILKYQGVNADNSDGTMRALSSATKLVPYDSALFLVTDKGPGDPQRYPLALRALVEKRLKVYTIWTDPLYPSDESEAALQGLRNISLNTGGEVLPYSLQVAEMEGGDLTNESQDWDEVDLTQPRRARLNSQVDTDDFETLLVRRGGGGATSLGLPVENGVTALRIYIEGAVEHAVLYPPNDAPQIDLYNLTSVKAFSSTSRTDGLSPREVYLVFPGVDLDMDMLTVLPAASVSDGPAATVGLWHLSVRCDTCDYRLAVAARGQIHFQTDVQHAILKLKATGPIASIRESLLVNEYGAELSKLPFNYQPIRPDGQSVPLDGPIAELAADVQMPKVEGSRIYAKIVGRDIHGHPFARLSGPLNHTEVRMGRSASILFPNPIDDLELAEELNSRPFQYRALNQFNETTVLPSNRAVSQTVNQRGSILTAVQIGLGTRLYGAPGDNLQLQFEVTNYRDQSVRFNFEATGELRFLRGINPSVDTVASGQTTIVIVSVGITATATPGARDLITFTAYSTTEQLSISAYVYVTNPGDSATDVWPPELRHTFQGTCIGKTGGDCATHTWSATVIARDAVGGLLRLTSTPVGLTYSSAFIAGSREEVTAVYRATCCAPRVVVSAVDAFGNANSYVVDISNYFTEAAVAAIVLGVFLLIAIIALIVFLIYWCVKKRRESRELPASYSSRSKTMG